MFNKIMKRGGRKAPKGSGGDPIDLPRHPPDPIVPPPSMLCSSSSNHPTPRSQAPSPMVVNSPSQMLLLEPMPAFRDAASQERPNLFLRKVRICSLPLDMSDTLRYPREKEAKRLALLDLVDYMQTQSNHPLSDALQEELLRMVASNIFRPLPPPPTGTLLLADPEEEDPYYDPAWPHLQIVYELLLRYVVSPDTSTKTAKRYLDHAFVLHLLDLFSSDDAREREYLKTVLHRIYGKFMLYRPFIRNALTHIFHAFVFEAHRHSGIAELLEILASIIAGFALPMKEEHRLFLTRTLLPLHRPNFIGMYHHHLSYCVTQYLDKDPKLAHVIVSALLRYWPLTNCQKEVLFLAELEEVLELTHPPEFQKCMVPLFRQIARCLNSPHFQVAERALFLWNNDHVVSLIAQNRSVIFPIIFEALEKNLQGHWNQAVHGLTANVRKMFMDMDNDLFEECQQQHAENEANAKASEKRRELIWKKLEESVAAKTMDEDMVEVTY